jgi:ribosomal-protein-alanine N-acetyltransferase
MELQTERLLLKELSLADIDEVHQLHSLSEVDEFNTLGIPQNTETTAVLLKEWLNQQEASPRMSYTFRITLVQTNQFIGLIALNLGRPNFKIAEVWYKLNPACWRNGYMKEALISLLKFAFGDLKLHRVEAGCAIENLASIKLLENVGMTREGRKREVLPIRGKWIDNYFYAILETDFETRLT